MLKVEGYVNGDIKLYVDVMLCIFYAKYVIFFEFYVSINTHKE